MGKILDISGVLGLILLALTLLWAGAYNLKLKQIKRGILFIIFGLLLAIILAKELLAPNLQSY